MVVGWRCAASCRGGDGCRFGRNVGTLAIQCTSGRKQEPPVCSDDASGDENQMQNVSAAAPKTIKEIHNEIQAIIRQITASVRITCIQCVRLFLLCMYDCFSQTLLLSTQVTFLPLLSEPCSFDLLVYTNKAAKVPKKWEDSDPRYIMNSQEVKLRSFTTSVSLDSCLC